MEFCSQSSDDFHERFELGHEGIVVGHDLEEVVRFLGNLMGDAHFNLVQLMGQAFLYQGTISLNLFYIT